MRLYIIIIFLLIPSVCLADPDGLPVQVDYNNIAIPYMKSDGIISYGSFAGLKFNSATAANSQDTTMFSVYKNFYLYYAMKQNTDLLAQNQLLLSHQITSLQNQVADMDPLIITQSISFLVGAFIAIAFVVASSLRF